MNKPSKKWFSIRWYQLCILGPIPFIWILLSHFNYLKPLENLLMDLRFQVRGEIQTDIKVWYVNRDQYTTAQFGEDPFPRSYYADTARSLFELGGIQSIFFDFNMSPMGMGVVIPQKNLIADELAMVQLQQKYGKRVVLASTYSNTLLLFSNRISSLPVKYRPNIDALNNRIFSYDPKENPFPETPTYPIWNPSYAQGNFFNQGWGTVGMIDIDVNESAGAIDRWIPLYVETAREENARNFIAGIDRWQRLNKGESYHSKLIETEKSLQLLETDPEGNVLGLIIEIPKIIPKTFFTAALELLITAHGLESNYCTEISDKFIRVTNPLDGDKELYKIPLTKKQLVEINWFSGWESNNHESMANVLKYFDWYRQGNDRQKTFAKHFFNKFKDAIVLVGPTDPLMQDLAPTPFDSVPRPKVAVHGNLLKTIHSSRYIQRISPAITDGITIILTLLVSSLFLYSNKHSHTTKLLSNLLLVSYLFIAFEAFNRFDLVIPLVLPLGSALSTAFVGLTIQLFIEESQKSRIKSMFGTYVSPDLVDRMIESDTQPHLGGINENISALFSDIQNFSSFSELLLPEQLVELMNDYLSTMTHRLQENGGTLDKYMGDAIVGMFGAPLKLENHAFKACITAIEMQRELEWLRQKWARQKKWPEQVHQMRMRIGLNSGSCTVGNMGSKSRFQYTMMGDMVNLAARCESGAKYIGVYTMTTEVTHQACLKETDLIQFRYLDKWQVKGRKKATRLYEILGYKKDLSDETLSCIQHYEAGLAHYFAQNWDAALDEFKKSHPLEPHRKELVPNSPTTPSSVMIERCIQLKENPPTNNWDGVFHMRKK